MAYPIYHKALRDGTLHKPTHCEQCFRREPPKRIHGHHDDYRKPLDVRWLCPPCHAKAHTFKRWMDECYEWLEYCQKEGLKPECANQPHINRKTGEPTSNTEIQYWRQNKKNRYL